MADRWYRTKLAENLQQVNAYDRRQNMIERLMRKQQDGTLGKETKGTDGSAEDMGISVGDQITYNLNIPKQAADSTPQPSKLSSLAKYGAVAGLALAAPYIPTWAGLAIGLLNRPAAEAPAFEDTDTSVDIELQVGP